QGGIPLLGSEVAAAKLGEVEEDGARSLLPEASDGADAKGGLAHLAGVEDVAIFASAQGSEQLPVGLALDVGAGIRGQRAASDVERDGGRCRAGNHEVFPRTVGTATKVSSECVSTKPQFSSSSDISLRWRANIPLCRLMPQALRWHHLQPPAERIVPL